MIYLEFLTLNEYAPSSLYKIFSCIKMLLLVLHDIDADKYLLCKKWLNNNSIGYQPKQAPIFTKSEVHEYINIDDPTLIKRQIAAGFTWYGRLRKKEAAFIIHSKISLMYKSMCSITLSLI